MAHVEGGGRRECLGLPQPPAPEPRPGACHHRPGKAHLVCDLLGDVRFPSRPGVGTEWPWVGGCGPVPLPTPTSCLGAAFSGLHQGGHGTQPSYFSSKCLLGMVAEPVLAPGAASQPDKTQGGAWLTSRCLGTGPAPTPESHSGQGLRRSSGSPSWTSWMAGWRATSHASVSSTQASDKGIPRLYTSPKMGLLPLPSSADVRHSLKAFLFSLYRPLSRAACGWKKRYPGNGEEPGEPSRGGPLYQHAVRGAES